MNVFAMLVRIIVLAVFQFKFAPGFPLETISAVTQLPEKTTQEITYSTEESYYTTQTIDYADTTETNDVTESTESSQEVIESFPPILLSPTLTNKFKPGGYGAGPSVGVVISMPYNCNPNQLFDGYGKCRDIF